MTDLTHAGGNNPAGLFLVRCVPVVGVASLPIPATSGPLQVGAPTFQTGWSWQTLYGTENTKSFSEDEQLTDNGPQYDVSISFYLPGDSADRRQTLAQMVRHRYILECQDNTGLWRRLGTLTEGLEFRYKFTIGAQVGDRRGYTLTFSGSLSATPPLLISN